VSFIHDSAVQAFEHRDKTTTGVLEKEVFICTHDCFNRIVNLTIIKNVFAGDAAKLKTTPYRRGWTIFNSLMI